MEYQNMNYSQIKELDLESEKKLTDDPGPADECICNILAPPTAEKKGVGGQVRDSFRRAFRNMSGSGKKRQPPGYGAGGGAGGGGAYGGGLIVPLTDTPGGGGFFTRKETVKRGKPCGRSCGCNDTMTMKHTEAVIKITTPDISNVCPCPGGCLPGAEKLNNVSVVVEHLTLLKHLEASDSEDSVTVDPPKLMEPAMLRKSITKLIEAQYEIKVEDNSALVENREKIDELKERNDKNRHQREKTRQSFMDGKREEKETLPEVVFGDDDDDSDWSFGIDDWDVKLNQKLPS